MLLTKFAFVGILFYDHLTSVVRDVHEAACFVSRSSSFAQPVLQDSQDTRNAALLHVVVCSSVAVTYGLATVKNFYKPRYWPRFQTYHPATVRSAYRDSIPAVKPPICRNYVSKLLRTTSPAQRIPAPTSINNHIHPSFEWTPKSLPPPPPLLPQAPLVEAPRPALHTLSPAVGLFSLVVMVGLVLWSVMCLSEDGDNEHHIQFAQVKTASVAAPTAFDGTSVSQARINKLRTSTCAAGSKIRSKSRTSAMPDPSLPVTPTLCRFVGGRRFSQLKSKSS